MFYIYVLNGACCRDHWLNIVGISENKGSVYIRERLEAWVKLSREYYMSTD